MSNKPRHIHRAARSDENPYFQFRRDTAQDRNLTFEARGVLAYILSKPDDWEVQPSDLEQNCGKSVVYRILKELRKHNYIQLVTTRDENHRIISWDYEVYEQPLIKKQEVAFQEVEKQELENRYTTKNRVLQNTDSNKEQNKENTSATSAGSFSDSHEVGTQPAADDKKETLNAFEGFVSTLDIDTAAPLDRIPEDELEPMPPYEEPPLILHECKETDIAEMIAAWWEWVPLRPALRGKPSTLADHIKIPTNREYARNLFERGVRPIDFVRVLNGLRLHPPAEGHKEMPFQYVCPMVDTYVSQNRSHERGAFTEQDPRWAAKKPGTACVYLGENLWERKDLFVDLAPRYITIAQLTKQAEETETYAPQPSEFDTWTAEDWEKDGNRL
mgnify:CR=1 FL=1